MRVLVTGGTGQLGRQLLLRLAPQREVFALTRTHTTPAEPDSVTWIRQDLTRPLERAALPDRIDAVVHLAQSERYRDFPEGAEDVFEVNVHGTFRLLEYAREAGASAFLLASTGGLYELSGEPITETAPTVPAAPYFRSKRMAELLLEDYSALLRTHALRLFFVYGPGGGTTLVPRFAARILNGEEIVVDGDPGLRINPIYTDDAAAAIEAALELEENTVINVAGEEVVSVTELARRLAGALGRELKLRHEGTNPQGNLIADTTLMRSKLGGVAKTSLEEGLAAVARSLAVPESR